MVVSDLILASERFEKLYFCGCLIGNSFAFEKNAVKILYGSPLPVLIVSTSCSSISSAITKSILF